jgi:SprT protein
VRSTRVLGSVGELAADWGLTEQLEQAAALGPAFREMLDCGVEISRRAKTLAGAAYTEERRIVLNVVLLEKGRESDRDATFLHECAHILADLFHGRPCKHSEAWREVMKLLGEKPAVRHELSYLSRAAHAVVTWQCENCGDEYHFVRRPRRRPSSCYCRACGPEHGQLRVVKST